MTSVSKRTRRSLENFGWGGDYWIDSQQPVRELHIKVWERTMKKLAWFCLLLFSLFGQLWSIPRPRQQLPAWSPVNDEDAMLNWEPLVSRRSFTGRLGVQTEDYPSDTGPIPSSFNARDHFKEALIGSFFQNMQLRRLWESARKQDTKRRNFSHCFWKFCV